MALTRIGWGYYVAFASPNGSEFGCRLLIFPETNVLTLEEINSKFGDAVAVHLQENEADLDTISGDRKPDVDF
ncbi:hypothetical protein EDD22DRAFT_956485 [Suillus occidentalis]|nr:hypothetical protein EDD22DRAFT_956485 [Suillus occidentalis]